MTRGGGGLPGSKLWLLWFGFKSYTMETKTTPALRLRDSTKASASKISHLGAEGSAGGCVWPLGRLGSGVASGWLLLPLGSPGPMPERTMGSGFRLPDEAGVNAKNRPQALSASVVLQGVHISGFCITHHSLGQE